MSSEGTAPETAELSAVEVLPNATAEKICVVVRQDDLTPGYNAQIGVRCEAELRIPNAGGLIIQHLSTPGTWGIEAEANEDFIREVARDEFETLSQMLNILRVLRPLESESGDWPIVYR